MTTKRLELYLPSRTILLLLTVAVAGFGQTFKVEPIANPSGPGSVQAHWSMVPDGSLLLSWIEPLKDGSYTLKYAIHRGSQWSEPRTVAAHRHFFRHPAESPEVISFRNGSLLAHWVEMPDESSDAEFVYVSVSKDGVHWTAPVLGHENQSPVQHGLVSAVASGDGEASLIWLEALNGEDAPTSLKRTTVNLDGKVTKEERLDPDVCGCCPTAIVKTARGLLVAYRSHTPQDIRDIAVMRFENGRWSPSKILSPDKWKLNACPTNAASASADGERVAIAWYTGAQSLPRTQVAFSTDSGSTFGKPVLVSTGHSFGYSSVVLDDEGRALVSWLERGTNTTRILVRQITPGGVAGPVVQIAQGPKQSLGYPRLLHAGNDTWIAWGNSAETKIQTARLVK
jgi:hypothetical protein